MPSNMSYIGLFGRSPRVRLELKVRGLRPRCWCRLCDSSDGGLTNPVGYFPQVGRPGFSFRQRVSIPTVPRGSTCNVLSIVEVAAVFQKRSRPLGPDITVFPQGCCICALGAFCRSFFL